MVMGFAITRQRSSLVCIQLPILLVEDNKDQAIDRFNCFYLLKLIHIAVLSIAYRRRLTPLRTGPSVAGEQPLSVRFSRRGIFHSGALFRQVIWATPGSSDDADALVDGDLRLETETLLVSTWPCLLTTSASFRQRLPSSIR